MHKSILKQPASRGCSPGTSNLAVHFPPSSSLTTHTFVAYSSAAYDRSPIQVSPNSCALPERGCPGRTYTLDDPASRYHTSRGIHPRALNQRQLDAVRPMPSLIPDLSSESDESDAFSSPPAHSRFPLVVPYAFNPDPYAVSPISPTALAFLPHPPSPPSSRSTFPCDDDDDDDPPVPKPRRRRERKHDPSRTPDRIPDCPTLRSPTKKRVPALARALQASFDVEDDGCLGGF